MARIFLGLAVIATLLLVASIWFGYRVEDFAGTVDRYRAAVRDVQQLEGDPALVVSPQMQSARRALQDASNALERVKKQRTFHTLLGIAASLVAVLVNSITVTYFVGTSRWCREVVEAYQLDEQLVSRSRALKRSAFPWALLGILSIIVIAASGPFADPASSAHVWLGSTSLSRLTMSAWVSLHAWVSIVGTVLVAAAFFAQLSRIAANYAVIDQILARVAAIRRQQGLDQGTIEKQPADNKLSSRT